MSVLCDGGPYWFEILAWTMIILCVALFIVGGVLMYADNKAQWLKTKGCQENCCPLFCSNSTDAPGCELSCLDECLYEGRREIVCRDRPEPQDA